jgi:signal peptidase II
MKTNHTLWRLLGCGLFLILVAIDQLTKKWAVMTLKDADPIVWIPNVFELHYLENRGAAFGILQGQKIFFVIMTVIVCIVFLILYLRMNTDRYFLPMRLTILLLLSGAVGNFIDRVSNNYVVDFFYFKLINFPIFNVADIYVVCAVIIFAFLLLFYYKEDDLKEVFHGGESHGGEERRRENA